MLKGDARSMAAAGEGRGHAMKMANAAVTETFFSSDELLEWTYKKNRRIFYRLDFSAVSAVTS